MFQRLEKPSYPELIIEQIKKLILDRELEPGDRLPAERELAQQFGVSRPSIREAIRALTALGLVDARTGDGTYVNTTLRESVLEPLSWAVLLSRGITRDLAEARKIIEPGIAALAAQRATASDKENLLETINSMRESIGTPPVVAEADLEFHMALAKAARNQILLGIMRGLQRLLEELITSHLMKIEDQKWCLQEHIEIYEAIQEGNAAKAEQVMFRSLHNDLTVLGERKSTSTRERRSSM